MSSIGIITPQYLPVNPIYDAKFGLASYEANFNYIDGLTTDPSGTGFAYSDGTRDGVLSKTELESWYKLGTQDRYGVEPVEGEEKPRIEPVVTLQSIIYKHLFVAPVASETTIIAHDPTPYLQPEVFRTIASAALTPDGGKGWSRADLKEANKIARDKDSFAPSSKPPEFVAPRSYTADQKVTNHFGKEPPEITRKESTEKGLRRLAADIQFEQAPVPPPIIVPGSFPPMPLSGPTLPLPKAAAPAHESDNPEVATAKNQKAIASPASPVGVKPTPAPALPGTGGGGAAKPKKETSHAPSDAKPASSDAGKKDAPADKPAVQAASPKKAPAPKPVAKGGATAI